MNIQLPSFSPWLRADEAGRYLGGLSRRRINQLRKDGILPAYQLSRKSYLFNRADLDEYATRVPFEPYIPTSNDNE